MTHPWFDYSLKVLGEKGPRSAESGRKKQCVVVPTHGVQAAEGMKYSIAFHLDCSLGTVA